jgi:hypothetical protein
MAAGGGVHTILRRNAMRGKTGDAPAARPPAGWAPWIAALLAAVAIATFLVLRQFALTAPEGRIKPALAPNALPSTGPVTLVNAPARVLAFLPAGADDTVGQALRAATGNPPGRFPGVVEVRPDGPHRFFIAITMPVRIRHLLATGEISTGGIPGSSDLNTGKLAVSTNNAIYGVSMNPRTRRAVFLFALSRNGLNLWALNWNALGIISQSASLQ